MKHVHAIDVDRLLAAIREDNPIGGGSIRNTGGDTAFPLEVWIRGARLWVRSDGRWASGYPAEGGAYECREFKGWNARRIRKAVEARTRRLSPRSAADQAQGALA